MDRLNNFVKLSIIALFLNFAQNIYAVEESPDTDNLIIVQPTVQVESKSLSSNLEKVAVAAKELIGTKYKFGGTDPENGFDCSGFVRYVFKEANIDLPRSSYDMKKLGHQVDVKSLKVGDLLFFKLNRSHVGIYIGNGKFIHSPTTGRSVTIESLTDAIYQKKFLSARRILD